MPTRNHVAEQLRELIAEADLMPGDRLPSERDLAAQLGVSRTSLREGLRRLADLGIVHARQGAGTYIAPLDLGDLLELRLRIEPLAARLAAQRHGRDDLTRLDAGLARMRATLDDAADFSAADVITHAAIADAAASLPIRVTFDAIADLLRHSRTATAIDPVTRDSSLAEMTRIVAAIRATEPERAERAMLDHLEHVGGPLAR
jgi:GntR family transcriptional regulator, transcriptional repressor for pyruvate dehydrogenase complex